MSTSTAGIYLAFPFCLSHCHYCSNPAARYSDEAAAAYTAQMAADLQQVAPDWSDHRFDSLFLGGGTPTLMPTHQLQRLIQTVQAHFDLTDDAEITSEANPDTLTTPVAEGLRSIGINRISIGAQSFDEGGLTQLGRLHDTRSVPTAVAVARAAGFDNLSLDLIYGRQGQTTEGWSKELAQALSLAPSHLSAYALTPEEGTVLWQMVQSGTVQLPDGDATGRLYQQGVAALLEGGYHRYEISNFARPGFECRHNQHYWQMDDWLGLGIGATSHRDGLHQMQTEQLDDYLDRPEQAPLFLFSERLAAVERLHEAAIFGLRTRQGIRLDQLPGGSDVAQIITPLKRLIDAGLVTRIGQTHVATERGLLLHDTIGCELAYPGVST